MVAVGWIMAIIVGAVAGWVAEQLRRSEQGPLVSVGLGVVGAAFGNVILLMVAGSAMGGILAQLVVAVVGASVFIGVARVLRGAKTA